MTTKNLKLSVSGAKLRNPEDLLNHDKALEAELAPPVVVPPPPAPPNEGIADAPVSMIPPAPPPEVPSRPPRPDYSGALADAQEQARNTRLISGMGRAGQAAITAVTGVHGSGALDDMAKDADRPVKDLDARMALDETQRKQAAADAADDPNSPQNRAAQAAFAKTNRPFAAILGEKLPTMTAAQLENFYSKYTAGEKFDDTREKWKATDATNQRKVDENTRQFDNELPVKKANAVSARITALRDPMRLTVEDRQTPIDERKDVDRADKLGKLTTPFAQYHAAFQVLDNLAPGLAHGKVPENYPLTSEEKLKLKDPTGISARVLGVNPHAQAIHQALEELIDLTSRDRSGAVLNAAEVQRYVTMIRNGVAAGPEQTAVAVNALRQAVAAKVRNAQASFKEPSPYSGKAPYDIYKDRGGLVAEDPVFADEAAEPPGQADEATEAAPEAAPQPAPQPTASAGPHPMDTTKPVQEPDEDVVYVRQKRTGRTVAMPRAQAPVFAGNPDYEFVTNGQ